MRNLYNGNWISAWEEQGTIRVTYHPNINESVKVPKSDTLTVAEPLFEELRKGLRLAPDYFLLHSSFSSYDGYIVSDQIYLNEFSYTKQDKIHNSIAKVLAKIDDEANDLHLEYLTGEDW